MSLVLLVALGWRAALVLASAIPLAASMPPFGMNLAGISIHQMSVTGLFGIQALLGLVGSNGASINVAIIVLSSLPDDPRAPAADREGCGPS